MKVVFRNMGLNDDTEEVLNKMTVPVINQSSKVELWKMKWHNMRASLKEETIYQWTDTSTTLQSCENKRYFGPLKSRSDSQVNPRADNQYVT